MEKVEIPKLRLPQSKPSLSPDRKPCRSRPPVWDCGSTLYDSFERTSFQRHLDSAISARSLSMPHRTDFRVFPHQISPAPSTPRSTLSTSFHNLLRSLFKKHSKKELKHKKEKHKESLEKETPRWFMVYDDDHGMDRKEKGVALTTIAEAPEMENKADVASPEIGAAVRKTMSERFTAASLSNRISSCA